MNAILDRWVAIRERIVGFATAIHQDKILDTSARIALGAIPVVGEPLLALYDGMVADGGPAAAELREVMRKLEALDPEDLAEIGPSLAAFEGSLSDLSSRLAQLDERLQRVQTETWEIRRALARVEEQMDELTARGFIYDPSIVPDRLTFFLHLSRLLASTKAPFIEHVTKGRELLDRATLNAGSEAAARLNKVRSAWGGLGIDDALRAVYPTLAEADRDLFAELRRLTVRIFAVHIRLRSMLESNRGIWENEPCAVDLRKLVSHLSFWIAKYELLKDDPAMCIIFVGVEPTNQPFPAGVDDAVAIRVGELRQKARLQDVLAVKQR